MMIKALVFDFHGLIIDTEVPVYQSWRELYHAYGCHLSFKDWSIVIGTTDDLFDPFDELEKQVGRPLERGKLQVNRYRRQLELIELQPIQPGVREYLEAAHRFGLKVGLASGSSCASLSDYLTRRGLMDYFDCIHGSEDVQRLKPDPDLYLSVLKDLNVSGEQAIAFEDSPNGILAAKQAGLFCVCVPNQLTRRLPLSQADLVVESLADLPLERLLAAREWG